MITLTQKRTPRSPGVFFTDALLCGALLCGALLCSACSDSAISQQEGDAGTALSGYSPCSAATKVGGFTVTLAKAFTGIDGQVLDGVVPQNVPEELQVSGSCRLLGAPNLSCSPACTSGQTCGVDGSCIDYPHSQSVGTISVTGLLADVTMTPQYGNNYTNPSSLPHPGFVEGADIRLMASGGDYEPFSLSGEGIGPLEVADQSLEVLVEPGKPVDLTWTAPETAGPGRIHIELNVNNHGTTSAWIACEAEDTGAFSIPADLVTALTDLGLSGGPTIVMTRRTADSTTVEPGCVDLVVASSLTLEVQVPGLVSCTGTEEAECPAPQTCQANLTCQ